MEIAVYHCLSSPKTWKKLSEVHSFSGVGLNESHASEIEHQWFFMWLEEQL